MSFFKRNGLIYLATLFTLAVIMLSQVFYGRIFPSVRYLAPFLGVVSIGLMFWPMFVLQQQGQAQPGDNYMRTTALVDGGLFAIVRHPQYLGYMCLNVTFILIAQHWLILLLGSLAIALFYLYALQEEKKLLEKFGLVYQAYMRRVPRFNVLLVLLAVSRRLRRR